MRRKKARSDFSFLKPLSALLPVFAFFLMICNFFVVFRFERDRRPSVVYYVATNVVSSVSPASDVPSLSSGLDVPFVSAGSEFDNTNRVPSIVVTETDYHYFLVGDRRCVKMFDRYFVEGSTTSYGRISVIFPDRILLDNGSYIVNTKWRPLSAGRGGA